MNSIRKPLFLIQRAMRELYFWSKAIHKNIHQLVGVIIFQGRLGMVSPWMENGDLRKYIRNHPEVDRYHLVGLTLTVFDYFQYNRI